ncbi:MAG: hypothetical protein L0H41_13100 [Microlunatus sp.]|nr:hypothetical protein [Microlunatus sp.]MDN5770570.1 hypothetical protein [Microlunatus sp.]
MDKRKHSSRHGQSGDPRRRDAEAAAEPDFQATPELQQEIESALASKHPIHILMLASSLVAGLETGVATEPSELPSPAEFVRMFLAGDDRLQLLAWAAAQLLPDQRLRVEVRNNLAPDALPAWLAAVEHAEIVAAWQTTDPLQDGSDVVVSLRLGEADLSVVGLVDLDSRGALKDGFAIPDPLPTFQQAFLGSDEAGMQSRDLAPADARAWLSGAIEEGRTWVPPFTSDSWPHARPLMEWAIGRCPSGGEGWHPQIRNRDEIEAVVGEFAQTEAGRQIIGRPEEHAVLVDALHVLAQETFADPLLLSAVRLQMGLSYLWATRLHEDADAVLALPDLLVPFVRYAHSRRGIPAADTDQALAAIAHCRAGYVADVAAANDLDD